MVHFAYEYIFHADHATLLRLTERTSYFCVDIQATIAISSNWIGSPFFSNLEKTVLHALHVNVNIKIKSKERIGSFCCFFSKTGGYAIPAKRAGT